MVLLLSHGHTRRFAIQVPKLNHPDLKLALPTMLFHSVFLLLYLHHSNNVNRQLLIFFKSRLDEKLKQN